MRHILRAGLPLMLLAGEAGLALGAAAAAQTPLDAYLDDLKTLRASFVQTLVDAHGKQIDRSSGVLIVVRPGSSAGKFIRRHHNRMPGSSWSRTVVTSGSWTAICSR